MTREQIIQALEECAERKCQPTVASALDVIRELQEEVATGKVMINLLQRDVADRDAMLEKKVEDIHPEFMRDYRAMREELEGLYDDLADAHQQIKELGKNQVKRGEWVHGENCTAHCSVCGHEEPEHTLAPFCRACGACLEVDDDAT